MNKKYLNHNGLSYLWGKIKEYVNTRRSIQSSDGASKVEINDLGRIDIESTSNVHITTTKDVNLKGADVKAENTSGNAWLTIFEDGGVSLHSVDNDIYVMSESRAVDLSGVTAMLSNVNGTHYVKVTQSGVDIKGDTNVQGALTVNGDNVATEYYAETIANEYASDAMKQSDDYTDGKFAEAKSYTDNKVAQATAYDTLLSGQYFKTATGTSNIVANIGSSWSSTYNFLLVHVYLNNARYTAVVEKSSNRASVLLQNPWTTSFSLYMASIIVNTNGDINFERCGTLSSSTYTEKLNSAGYYISKIVGVKVK